MQKRLSVFHVSVFSILATLIAGAGCKSKDDARLNDSGSFVVFWSPQSPSPMPTGLKIRAVFGRNDPLKPVAIPVEELLTPQHLVPVGARVEKDILSLQSIEITDSQARSLYRLERPELDPLRLRAVGPQQVGLELSLMQSGSLTAAIRLPEREYWELPSRDSLLEINELMPALTDFLRLDDTSDSLLKLRWAAEPTPEYLQNLMELVSAAPALDPSRLELILNGRYYPPLIFEKMKLRERELSRSGSPEDQEFAQILRYNLELADQLAEQGNQLVVAGLRKIQTLSFDSGTHLLTHLSSPLAGSSESSKAADEAFQTLLEKLGGSFESLLDQQKALLLDLAVNKRALGFASSLATEIFTTGTDQSAGRLLDLLRRFPNGPTRDRLTGLASHIKGELVLAQLAALLTPLESTEVMLSVAEHLIPKIQNLTSEQIVLFTEQFLADDLRDTMILLSIRQAVDFSSEAMRSLLLLASDWSVRKQICAVILPKLVPLRGQTFAKILLALPGAPERDELVLQGLALMSSLRPVDYASLAQILIRQESFLEFVDTATPRLTPLRMAEALTTSDLLLSRTTPERDAFLLKAAEGILDLSWSNLEQLIMRASTDTIRDQLRAVATRRIGEQK
ncbi:MAG: hypothetical protein ACK5QT_04615 [Oligoflexia bacterium]